MSVTILFIFALGLLAILTLYTRDRLNIRIGNLARQLEAANRERSASADNIALLYEASQATAQEAEPGGIMETLAEDARKIVGCDSASVAVFVEKDILASVTKGISSEFKRNLRWRVRKGGMTERVLTTGRPLVVNDARLDERAKESSAVKVGKLESIMGVPLACDNQVFGVLYLGDGSAMRFSDHDLMLVTILANHAAASLRQARLHRELKRKLEELECAHRELVGADRLKTDFLSTVTSEMRVPLDAIRTYSQTLLHRIDDPSFKLRKKFLGAVVEESMRLLTTVNGVIDLSRMEFGEGDLRREEVALGGVLKDVCAVLEPICIDKGVEVSVDAAESLSRAYLDKDMIFLLLRNLLEAAVTFSRPSAAITVEVSEDEEFTKIRVSLAPSPEAVKTEGSIRAVWGNEPVPRDAGSLGLTLQVCRNIVLRHGGRIWSDTSDDGSWCFTILFGRQRRSMVPSDLTFEIVTSRPELKRMFALVADMITKVMDVKRCLIFLEDPATSKLVLEATVGSNGLFDHGLSVEPGRGLTGRVFAQGCPIVLNSQSEAADLPDCGCLPFEALPCAAVPVRTEGRVVGVVTVSERVNHEASFDDGDVGLLAALADRIAVALERTTSYESARDQFVAAMTAMKAILEARRVTGAKRGVADSVVELAHGMGLGSEDVRLLQYVSRIYDVGMVKVGEGILRKRGGLGVSEYESVKRHPEAGVDLVGPIEFLEQVKQVIMHHHERYDGGGYPEGLKGEEIPMGARILAVVDSYSSMLSERPYRGALSRDEALEELRRCRGSQFDPGVVDKFIEIAERAGAPDLERKAC
jgi:GAF domain-containing protein